MNHKRANQEAVQQNLKTCLRRKYFLKRIRIFCACILVVASTLSVTLGQNLQNSQVGLDIWLAKDGYRFEFALQITNQGASPIVYDLIVIKYRWPALGEVKPGENVGVVVEQHVLFEHDQVVQTYSNGRLMSKESGTRQLIDGGKGVILHMLKTGDVVPSQDGKEPAQMTIALFSKGKPITEPLVAALPSLAQVPDYVDIYAAGKQVWRSGYHVVFKRPTRN